SILKVGPRDVEGGQQVILEDPIIDLFGEATNYESKEFFALLRHQGEQRWYVIGAAKSEPGGIFYISGVQFPRAGDFELMVALFDPGAITIKDWVEEKIWRPKALAVSQRVAVTVKSLPPAEVIANKLTSKGDVGEFSISILSIANISVSPKQ